MKFTNLLVAAGLGTCLVSTAAGATGLKNSSFSDVYTIGDSLVDDGNLLNFTNNTFPPYPFYIDGHFSNGPTWAELLPGKLGLTNKPQNNLAIGGSGSKNFHPIPQLNGVVGLQQQVNYLIGGAGGKLDHKALYIIGTGSNDYLYINASLDNVPQIVDNILKSVKQLRKAGARNFLVSGIPDYTRIPLFEDFATNPVYSHMSEQQRNSLGTLVEQHNNLLKSSLQDLSEKRKFNTSFFDINAAFLSLIADPAALGFTNITDACVDVDVISLPNSFPGVCANPNEYVFWDRSHPTAHTHQLLADVAAGSITNSNAVPEPLTILGTGIAVGFGAWFKQKLPRKSQKDKTLT